MNTKKILIIIILLFVFGGGYMLFAKTIKPAMDAEKDKGVDNGDGTITLKTNAGEIITVKKPESAEVQAAQIQNLKDSLSELDKQNASVHASRIYEDMKGWNQHEMRLYKSLLESPKNYFLYFVESAYPSFDKSKSFRDRLKVQNFKVTNKASKKLNLDDQNAIALVAKIVNRMVEFKV